VADTEIELKLAADTKALAALGRAAALERHARGRPTRRTLLTVYYDTPDGGLRRRGLALRVRRAGRSFVQTLKDERAGEGALSRRGEWEWPVSSLEPEPDAVTDPELRERLGALLDGGLQPVFTNRMQREQRLVEIVDGQGRAALIEVALDRGQLRCDDREAPVGEIELELVQGGPAALYRLALDLCETAPLRIETESKWARGCRLATGEPPSWHRADRPKLSPGVTVSEALGAILRACLSHWTANHAAAKDGRDPEGVHQLRVALRRLRSTLTLLKQVIPEDDRAWLREETGWLATSLAPARDLDVLATGLLPPVAAARPEGELAPLARAVEAARAEAYREVRAALASPRYTRLMLRLGLWLETEGWRAGGADALDEPVTRLADRLLARRHRQVLRRGEGLAGLGAGERHRLRIAVKRLRYAVEFFRGLYPKKRVKPFVEALAALQEDLGHLNDVAVATRLVARLAEAGDREALARTGGLLVGWHARGLADGEKGLLRDFARLAGRDPFWDG
jgi:triphosphatase